MKKVLNLYLRCIHTYQKVEYIKSINESKSITVISFARRVFKFNIIINSGLVYFCTYGYNNGLHSIWRIELK